MRRCLRATGLDDLVGAVGALDRRRQVTDARVRLDARLAQPLDLGLGGRRRPDASAMIAAVSAALPVTIRAIRGG